MSSTRARITEFITIAPIGENISLEDDHLREPIQVELALLIEVTEERMTPDMILLAVIEELQSLYHSKYRPDLTGMEPQIGGQGK